MMLRRQNRRSLTLETLEDRLVLDAGGQGNGFGQLVSFAVHYLNQLPDHGQELLQDGYGVANRGQLISQNSPGQMRGTT